MHQYMMVLEQLDRISAEKVLVEMAMSWQRALAARKANSCLRKDIAHNRHGPFPLLSAGKAHLEGWVQSWAPQHGTDVNMPGPIRGHQDGQGLEHRAYGERLSQVGLPAWGGEGFRDTLLQSAERSC